MAESTLRDIHAFPELVRYLEDELGWPLQEYGFDDLTFEYTPAELGLKEEDAARIKAIHQLRPLIHGQPWGIFFVEFENKKLPVVVLRRILSHLVIKKRTSTAAAPAWHAEDLLFVTAFGEDGTDNREIAFAHFHQNPGDLPTLHVLGWDGGDTPLKLAQLDQTLRERLHWPEDEADAEAWRETWRKPFRHKIGHVIRTADLLAEELARLARGIRDKARRMLAAESEKGPLTKLFKAFQTALIHDLTEAHFADTYAQTITYGLLTAAISRTEMSEGRHGTALLVDDIANIVPVTNPFLKEMLQTFLKVGGRRGGIDFDELGIQDVVELLRGSDTDLPAVIADFGNKNPNEDPVIHFYEHFLAAYDKPQKKQRGVFYTPQPVVSYIVRSVHELLQSEFGLEDGLASTVTWGEMAALHPSPASGRGAGGEGDSESKGGIAIPAGTSPDAPFVTLLDPATGTATFLVEVINVIHRTLTEKWTKQGMSEAQRQAAWNEYVPAHLLPRLYGYELMMAPYAIAHMKIGLKLFETGYHFGSEERVRVYLTNALEPAHEVQPQLEALSPALAHEALAVADVKRDVRFTVVIGNPPYSVTSANFNPFIDLLMNDYKKHVRGEQGLVALADDYLKFIRLSQKLLAVSNCGVWGMITNHGYLKGVIHRGVRKELLDQFNAIFLLDLHGDSNIGERVPTGKSNENVFDIQQGVAVSIGVRPVAKSSANTVFHSDLWGSRNEKYNVLASHPISRRIWTDLRPAEPRYFLVPFDDANLAEYEDYPSINELMPVNSCGVKTHRDGVVIDYDKKTLAARIADIASESRLELLRERYGVTDTPHWKLKDAQTKITMDEVPKFIQRLTYRPFDYRWIYYNPAIIEKGDSKYPTLRHMLRSNLALLTARIQATGVFDAVFISQFLVEMKTAESSRSCTVFPLYLTDNSDSRQAELSANGRRPNLNPKVLHSWAQKLGTKAKGEFGLPAGLTPEDIFHYAYAVFHSPGYRSRYAEFLKIDFPRLPLTGNLELFRALAELGGELVALHLLESPKVNDFITRFEGQGDNSVPKKPTYKDGAVWINASQRFEGVPEAVWNFHVGGYQVCEKWLKDRKGRTLSDEDITHYQRVVVALNETIRLMAEIDRVIETHGGWPGAFASNSAAGATT
ncbi:MAG: type ISP restriction/modification enzyme [Pseudomonadota bacterium]|nr:type ISP restriction/modification enzyme [Pseudomonadota bacterium]